MPVRKRVYKCGDIRIYYNRHSKILRIPFLHSAPTTILARITLICGADYVLLPHNPGLKPGAIHIKPSWGFQGLETQGA